MVVILQRGPGRAELEIMHDSLLVQNMLNEADVARATQGNVGGG